MGGYQRPNPSAEEKRHRHQQHLYEMTCNAEREAEQSRRTVFEPHRSSETRPRQPGSARQALADGPIRFQYSRAFSCAMGTTRRWVAILVGNNVLALRPNQHPHGGCPIMRRIQQSETAFSKCSARERRGEWIHLHLL